MPSIYTQLRSSDRKHIRTEKARIRREFLDLAKQEELISALYVKMLGKPEAKSETLNPKSETSPKSEIQKPKKETKKKVKAK